jgi:hypothetical protein
LRGGLRGEVRKKTKNENRKGNQIMNSNSDKDTANPPELWTDPFQDWEERQKEINRFYGIE